MVRTSEVDEGELGVDQCFGVVQELEIRWKFQDTENLYLAGMVNEAQDVIAQLQNDIQQLDGCMLQKQVFECKILRFKAKFCLDSDPQSA